MYNITSQFPPTGQYIAIPGFGTPLPSLLPQCTKGYDHDRTLLGKRGMHGQMKYINTTFAAYRNIHANQACIKVAVFHCQHQLYSIEDFQTEKANTLQLPSR